MAKRTKKIEHFVSVIAPLYNNKKEIKKFTDSTSLLLKKHYTNYEIVFIDNGSTDKTVRILTKLLTKYPCIRLIRLSRKYDMEITIFAGLDVAIGDSMVIMLAQSDPPKYIPKIVSKLTEGFDVVYATTEKKLGSSFWSNSARKIFYWYSNKYLNLNIPKNATHFMALNRRVTNALIQIKSYYRHTKLQSAQFGFATSTISYAPKSLSGIAYEEGLKEAVNQGFDVIFAYSRHPLRFVSLLGIAASVVNLLYAVYVLLIFTFKKEVAEGWTTLSLQTSVMFFFVFFLLTILSEYIGKILEETRDRPPYHIIEELNSKVSVANKRIRNVVL